MGRSRRRNEVAGRSPVVGASTAGLQRVQRGRASPQWPPHRVGSVEALLYQAVGDATTRWGWFWRWLREGIVVLRRIIKEWTDEQLIRRVVRVWFTVHCPGCLQGL